MPSGPENDSATIANVRLVLSEWNLPSALSSYSARIASTGSSLAARAAG